VKSLSGMAISSLMSSVVVVGMSNLAGLNW
jgi:hypothetical protein